MTFKLQKDNRIFDLSFQTPKQIGWNVPIVLKKNRISVNKKCDK